MDLLKTSRQKKTCSGDHFPKTEIVRMKSCNNENLTLTNNDLHLFQQSRHKHVENRATNQIAT